MGATLRPLTESDKRFFNKRVKIPLRADPMDTVECKMIFSDLEEDVDRSKFKTQAQYYKRGYISLPIRVANPFLLSHKYSIVAKALGRSTAEVVKIASGHIVYDLVEEREVDIKELATALYDDSRYLIGADYLYHAVSKVDVDARICDLLMGMCKSALYNTRDVKGMEMHEIGEVSTKPSQYLIIEDFYYHPIVPFNCDFNNAMARMLFQTTVVEEGEDDLTQSMDSQDDEEFSEDYDKGATGDSLKDDKAFGSVNSTIQILLAMRGKIDTVLNCFMNYVVVLPIGYRPSIENRRDPITHQYNMILNESLDLANTLKQSNGTVKNICSKYGKLVRSIKTLMVDDSGNRSNGYKSLATLLKGKEGVMRGELHSVITDGSGRTVITVDPEMPCDTIGVPYAMLEKLFELDILNIVNKDSVNKSDILAVPKAEKKSIINRIAREAYIPVGRQPTLYYLGIQAYRIKPVEGNALVLNPLMTPAFNADFDGDQMYGFVPMRESSKKEVADIMFALNNVFLPRNGEIHIAPRQEMIYGLWQLTRKKPDMSKQVQTIQADKAKLEIVMQGVKSGEIALDAPYKVISSKGVDLGVYTAGRLALKRCFPRPLVWSAIGVLPLKLDGKAEDDKNVSDSWFKEVLKEVKLNHEDEFATTVNYLVSLGFNIAENYPPNISTLNTEINIDDLIAEFDNRISKKEELYNRGFYTIDEYSTFYSTEYVDLEKKVKSRVEDFLGENSGYYCMVKSGARGSMSNLVQLFGIKGRIMRSKTDSFNTAITNSLSKGLSAFEHFITAYGARQGILDKVIEVSEPGYVARRLGSSGTILSIVEHDCGTTDGISITFDRCKEQIGTDSPYTDDILLYEDVYNYAKSILIGRFIVGVDSIIDKNNVDGIINKLIFEKREKENVVIKKQGVKLRSVITCKNPCCVKCYGLNLGTHHLAVPGLPIGDIASQSISEPGTQGTMKKFQGGGVASKRSTATSFELLQAIMDNQIKRKNPSTPIEYDMISPVEGHVQCVSRGDGTKELNILRENDKGELVSALGTKKYVLYEDIQTKDYVTVGESIQKVQGLLSPIEIARYRGYREALEYIALTLFKLYKDDVYIDMKHFECVAVSMFYKVCIKSGGDFEAGSFYPYVQYCRLDKGNARFVDRLIGVKRAPLYKSNILEAAFFEDLGTVMNRAVLTGKDDLSSPTVRAMLGLKINTGSAVPGYREGR